MLGVLAALGDLGALRRVVQVGQAGVVELQVACSPASASRAHLIGVGGGQVGPELLHVRVDGRVDRGRAAPVVDHVRRRDGQLRRRRRHRPTAGSGSRRRRSSGPCRILPSTCRAAGVNSISPAGVVEPHGQVARRLADAAELVDEVHVPGRAAELAVGRRLQADVLLHRDHLGDGRVLDGPQLRRRRCVPAAKSSRAASSSRRAEQAADVVGAERRCATHRDHRRGRRRWRSSG